MLLWQKTMRRKAHFKQYILNINLKSKLNINIKLLHHTDRNTTFKTWNAVSDV